MTTFTRFVPYALGAALIVTAAGTAAAEPPESQETPRAHAVLREHSTPPASAPAPAQAVAFRAEVPRAVERNVEYTPRAVAPDSDSGRRAPRGLDIAPTPVRFSESAEVGDDQARQRVPPSGGGSRAGGGGPSGRSGGGGSHASGTARPRGGDRGSGPRAGSNHDSGRRASGSYDGGRRYPTYGDRDRSGRRDGGSYGYAVRRGSVRHGYYPRYNYHRSYRPSYYYRYYGNWGLGYYFWDPTWYGYGYGGYGYGAYDYGYASRYDDTGSVRVRVSPRDAQIYVDDYYVGVVDEFDGTFQRLRLEEGTHRIEVRLDGFDTLRFDVRVLLGSSITLRGSLRPLP